MRHYLRLSEEADGGYYWMFHNDQKRHRVAQAVIDEILHASEKGGWHDNEEQGKLFGGKLYNVLNGDGLLEDLRKQQWDSDEIASFILDLPGKFNHVPFEIMWDGTAFFALADGCHLIRQVTSKNRDRAVTLENRPVSMLFMACSPIDSQPVLAFEAEEDAITRQIEEHKLPLDLQVEDSGSLNGLRTSLRDLKGVDILHLTGHAKLDDGGPIFEMESDTGFLVKVTPDQLAATLKSFEPKLLFLSGCETGKTHQKATDSFAHAMVKKGISRVIGWGLPVQDLGAIRFAAALYKLLGEGLPLDSAVSQARQSIQDDYKTWSLLRVCSDGMPMMPMTDPDQPVVHRSKRKLQYKFLAKSKVKILQYGFVGRRRQVQQGLRVLKGDLEEKNGLLITGAAGVGKTTLTGRLVDRSPKKALLEFSGVLEQGDIHQKLVALFEEKGHQPALDFLNQDVPFEKRIKALFRGPFQDVETLLIFNDFEQNLEQSPDGHRLTSDAIEAFQPLLESLSWAKGRTQFIVTSRYPFTLEKSGTEWVSQHLQRIPLMGFRGADLRKKRRSLAYLEGSPFRASYEKFSGGNPRLLEWFEALAEHQVFPDLATLEASLQAENQKFIGDYLAQLLADQGEAFGTFLAKAAVYRTPVRAAAFAEMGSHAMLEKAVDLTLMEKEETAEPRYWVLPVIRDHFWQMVADPSSMHAIAYRWYDVEVAKEERLTYSHVSECVHHAGAAFRMKGCWHHAVALSHYFYQAGLYREGAAQLEPLIRFFSEAEAIEELKNGKGNSITFINDLGGLLSSMGVLAAAKPYYDQALAIRRQVLGEVHPATALSLNNLGYLLQVMGELVAAKPYYEQALAINRQVLGESHPVTAGSLNNLGGLLKTMGELAAAKPYYEQALVIYWQVLGEAHPDTARSLNNLGALLQAMGAQVAAKPYFEQALAIRRQVLGEAHPETAQSLNNLGSLLKAMGELGAAKPYFVQALAIRKKVLGKAHIDTAQSLNNLGHLEHARGELGAAKVYYEQALAIYRQVLGETHPDTVSSIWNLLILSLQTGDSQATQELIPSLLWLLEAKEEGLSATHRTVRGYLIQLLQQLKEG